MNIQKYTKTTQICIKILSISLLCSIPSALARKTPGDFDNYFKKMHKQHVDLIKNFERMWQDFDAYFEEEEEKTESNTDKTSKTDLIQQTELETETVKLPEYDIQKSDDKNKLTIVFKDLNIKKEDIIVELKSHRTLIINFPYAESKVTARIYANGIELEAEKKITQEKKDEKGNVLGSSSYTGYNAQSSSFPYIIDVSSAKKHTPKFEKNTLTLVFDSQTKESITVK